MHPEPDPPLAGYVVIDLSSGIAGAYCTKLLADGGAEVIKVEPPEGDPLRGWSASGAEIPDGADGGLFSFLSCSKRSVIAEPDADDAFVDALLAGAHAVIWSRGPGVAGDGSGDVSAKTGDMAAITVESAPKSLAAATSDVN